ncbi:hypothetical protein LAZ67_1002021 [Cordylochernes scorpioides]|uniref:Reverse transcriptase domain-containing protein n=1 Tax=Cordylochernes scorpioides TaxID=51811 RepID=A0ABY6JVT8_9ARAC|nr:hypothetical protein LAZ67_1002021 [Cordylochernes scorpioides]
MDQRTCIKFCVKNEIKCADAFRMLTVAYGEATLDRSNVYRWYKMFSEGREDVNDEERVGRPSTSTTDEKINEVEKMILANRRITVREVAEDLNISIGSCHSIFINDLGMRRVAAKFVPKLLNCDQKQHRMNIANEMLDSVRDDPNLLQRVITGDEAWVYGYDVETKAQSSQWKLPHEPRPKKARQVRSNVKVLLTVFFDCRGVVHHKFLPQGRTVNKEYYLQVMRNLREAIRQKRPDLWKNKNWLLHHDNAPAHTSLLVRDFLAKNNTLMMPQPPYSPDLAPCDFFLFPKLKRPMKGRRYATLDEIKTASKEELKKIFKYDFLKCLEDWKNRWHKCIISHGDYFEGDKGSLQILLDFKVDDQLYSDHHPLVLTIKGQNFNEKKTKREDYNITRYRWSADGLATFKMKLEELREKNIPASADLVYTFNQRILEAMSSAKITYSIKGGPRKSKPWFDKDCYDMKKLAKESLKKYRKTNRLEDRECYASSRKKYLALLDLKRKGFDNEKQEILRNAKDSKTFWKTIALYKSTSIIQGEISIQDWLNFYRELMTTEKNLRICNLHNVISQNDPILDSEITNADIYKEIAGLRSNKACGPDGIPNEVLKTLPDSYILLLKQLYNSVMTTGKYPAIWTNSTIHPIFKNGYKNSPSNYRGIALISNVSKLFTSILRSRLEEWVEGRRVIPENQAGFRKERSCIDHIFTLTTLIQLSLRKKRGKLYVFFVDLRKAFDTVPHSLLWKKLYNLGISYQFISTIKSYYEQATIAIRWKGLFTESIKINSGVLQGEHFSPLLFILFITDLIEIYNNSDLPSVNLPEFGDIHLLLYADDIAIIGESRINLQKKIKILKEYLDENLMTLNESKSKIMVFRNGEGREDVNDEVRAGRPSTSTTDEKINEVEKMILANRRITVREVAEDLNISIGSCHSIFINDLGMRRVAAKFVSKLLNCDQKQHRMNIAIEMLDSVREDPNLLQRVITGDEAGVVHHEFLPQGRTVNKEYYLQVMRNLREAIRQKRPDLWKNKNWLLHHDNAPAHTLLLVRDFLAKNNTLMMPQPPYSPDLAPCDFFLFPKLKRLMKGRRYATLDEIKTASKEELKKIFKK